ncbi:ABC transporter substrate-binding protein [Actinomyces sp.]|uniref:ABC transporter substrate-binding protein n=1 Tax=Actinomyces sp. TaxID=29317 RepID=UPI0026DC8F5D|nr:sugar ABC transporter substrate-binding protein [Actinomyces sp.]MDO4899692.1 sugar ABC transporter substrate-binding protein [Actinomyces sp.]
MSFSLTRRRFIGVSGLAAALAAVTPTTACSNSDGSAGEGSGAITYWASNQGASVDDDNATLTPLLEAFTAKTGIQVNLEVIGWNDLQTRIQTAVTSGDAPDVVNIGNTWAVSLQATGAFLEFDDAAMEAVGGADKFVETALATCGAEGTTPTSLPLYGLAYGLYYNRKMFTDAGLEPPNTWEEMVAAAKRLTNPDNGIYGMAIAAGSYTENAHYAFINAAQEGEELFDSDGNPTFTGDGVVRGILRYLDLMQTDAVVNTSNAQYDNGSDSVADFANGKAAMIINQNNADTTIVANGMTTDQFGVVPYPAPANAPDDTASHVAGINIAVFANTGNRDGALQLVKYLTEAQQQATLGEQFKTLPVLKDEVPTFTDDDAEAAVFMDVYENRAKPLPLVPAEDQFESSVGQAMNDMFASVATGTVLTADDVRKALQSAQDTVSAAIG